ncbi:MAG: aminotransferase class I/II-fold pyridoxal phosphate-dependent enzyme, partial [Rhodocyclaceae bacterium]|nr:aminotransferase class I/II-fold pyridoxal phosphate-dependent enzyme [Rhodocyclaceae bacterium]
MEKYQPDTLAVRTGIHRSQFGEHSEAMYLTSSFVFDNAAQAAEAFQKGIEGRNVYSRFTNPTVTAFEERLAALEGAECCVATASGMSAILAITMALFKAGDHVVISQGVFGSTVQLFTNFFEKFGMQVSFVPPTDPSAWEAAVRPNTKMFFIETPSNPLTEVSDIGALAAIAHRAGAVLIVDNCFCSPALQQPLELGADIIIHSATKYLDGQGRV